MARARDILYRFRPAGSPGAAGAAGVPVDRAADLEHELGPILARLSDTEAACDDLLERARDTAATRHRRDLATARALVAAAREAAVGERAAAAAAAHQAGDAELCSLRAAAQREADQVRQRAAAHMPDLVGRVVQVVRASGEPAVVEPSEGA